MSSIPYCVKRNRRSKCVRIVVRCDGVVVTAPRFVPKIFITRFVEQKMEWILGTMQALQKKERLWVIPKGTTRTTYAACKEQARAFIHERVNFYTAQYGFAYRRIAVKNMKSRWGSCSEKKNLNFHYRLLFLPVALADYVIVHELCHLQELNHSKKFWARVEKTMSDYVAQRKALRQYTVAG